MTLLHLGFLEFNYDVYGDYFRYSNFVAISPQSFKVLEPFVKWIL